MASPRPRLLASEQEPSDVKFYRLSLEREQARARRLSVWLISALALSLVLNGVLALWVAGSNRRTVAASDVRARLSTEELTSVRQDLDDLSSELQDARTELKKVTQKKIGSARQEMRVLRRCLHNARTSLRRAVTRGGKGNPSTVLGRLRLPACNG